MLARTFLNEGKGIPLVFFHGFLGTAEDWKPVCSYLPSYHCIGYDLPGHGRSPFREDFIIEIPYFHLIGYSMGGRLALQYREKYPHQIATLTLISTHPGLTTEIEKEERLRQDSLWAQRLLELPIDQFLSLWYQQTPFASFKPDLTKRKNQNIPDLAASLIQFSLAKQKLYQVEEGIAGIRDTKYHHLYKRTILIPDAGHAVHLENPKALAQAIISHIAKWR